MMQHAQKQTADSHTSAQAHQILLLAIMHGVARWEWLTESRINGEVCLQGVRCFCPVDSTGLPRLHDSLLARLKLAVSRDTLRHKQGVTQGVHR